MTHIYSLRVTAGASIKSIQASVNGRELIVNATDKVLRLYSILEDSGGGFYLELLMKFLDSVDQNRWAQCSFTDNGNLIVGGAASKHEHNIFIWDKDTGSLVKILEGPRQGLLDFASVEENWSAFAPGKRLSFLF
ncbi:hypothetical protein HDU67_004359 [Dinochytrium kinnereticum]|nr:hypothetical protein HDU67_004359 [Dinochytrium kinnereticum]